MQNGPITFGLIGCGRISNVHLDVLEREPRARLVAVADIDEAAARATGEARGVPAFTGVSELLARATPQAVILCTPPNSHRALAETALAAGAHVLCEKPLAIALEDAQAMAEAAAAAGRLLMMASKFRYVSDVVRAKGLIRSGLLGEIVLLENEFCSRVAMSRRWNSDPGISGGGVLIDNGSHSVDIVRYLAGPIEKVKAIFGKQIQPLPVEDTARLFACSRGGIIESIDLSWSVHKECPYYIHVFGTEGVLEVGWKESRYRKGESHDWVAFGQGYDKLQAVGAQLGNFIDVLLDLALPLITIEDALESVRVIQSAYRSAREERWDELVA